MTELRSVGANNEPNYSKKLEEKGIEAGRPVDFWRLEFYERECERRRVGFNFERRDVVQ